MPTGHLATLQLKCSLREETVLGNLLVYKDHQPIHAASRLSFTTLGMPQLSLTAGTSTRLETLLHCSSNCTWCSCRPSSNTQHKPDPTLKLVSQPAGICTLAQVCRAGTLYRMIRTHTETSNHIGFHTNTPSRLSDLHTEQPCSNLAMPPQQCWDKTPACRHTSMIFGGRLCEGSPCSAA
jgi:hypothetical protein